MYCRKCGFKNVDGAKFCRNCGTPFAVAATQTPAEPELPKIDISEEILEEVGRERIAETEKAVSSADIREERKIELEKPAPSAQEPAASAERVVVQNAAAPLHSVEQVVSEEKKGKGNKTVLIVVIIVLAALLAGTAGYIVYDKFIKGSDSSLGEEADEDALNRLTGDDKDNLHFGKDDDDSEDDDKDKSKSKSADKDKSKDKKKSSDEDEPVGIVEPGKHTAVTGNQDYVLPDSASRVYTKEEIMDMPLDQLRLARNELYARHGRKFQDDELQAYFDSKPWYKGTIEAADFTDDMLTDIERSNKDLIVDRENELNH